MRELTLEEIGVDLNRVIRLFGGVEKIVQHLDEEQRIFLIRSLGKEKVRQLLEWVSEEPEGDETS